jgi:hypothetical protein
LKLEAEIAANADEERGGESSIVQSEVIIFESTGLDFKKATHDHHKSSNASVELPPYFPAFKSE